MSNGALYVTCADATALMYHVRSPWSTMLDVRPTRRELDCSICDFNARSYSGLQWHYDAVHPGQSQQRGGGSRNVSGQERRRRKLLARRLAREALLRGTPASGPEEPPAGAPSAAPPIPAPPAASGRPRREAAAAGHEAAAPVGSLPGGLDPTYGPTAPPTSPLRGDAEPADMDRAVQAEVDGLLELARVSGVSPSVQPAARKRVRKRRREDRSPEAPDVPAFEYATLQTKIRAMFEDLNDWQASTPLAVKRRRAKEGKFNTVRLRALQRLVLSVGGGGLSLKEQKKLYDFLVVWDSIRPSDDGKLQDTFPTFGSFKTALRDDVDAAVSEKGWRKVSLVEGGQSYQAFFTPALGAILDLVREDKKIRLWSGPSGPAPPTSLRETPLDGDAFRAAEKVVIEEHGPNTCVLGIHMFSDAFQLSWSGGTPYIFFPLWAFCGCDDMLCELDWLSDDLLIVPPTEPDDDPLTWCSSSLLTVLLTGLGLQPTSCMPYESGWSTA